MILIENLEPKCSVFFDRDQLTNSNQNIAQRENANQINPNYQSAKISSKNTLHSVQHTSMISSNSPQSSIQGQTSQSNPTASTSQFNQLDLAKKTCIESSRHILTHNGLVLKHPTLKLVTTTTTLEHFEPIEKERLQPLEFFLQLESKNLAQNAQYFDLVLKVCE